MAAGSRHGETLRSLWDWHRLLAVQRHPNRPVQLDGREGFRKNGKRARGEAFCNLFQTVVGGNHHDRDSHEALLSFHEPHNFDAAQMWNTGVKNDHFEICISFQQTICFASIADRNHFIAALLTQRFQLRARLPVIVGH